MFDRFFSLGLTVLLAVSVSWIEVKASGFDPLMGGLDHSLLSEEAFPLAPVALIENRLYDVVSGQHGRAVIEEAGTKTLAPWSASLCLAKGERFADGVIEILESSVKATKPRRTSDSFGSKFGGTVSMQRHTKIDVRLRASIDYEDVVMAVLFFDEYGKHAIHVEGLGFITSGMELMESFSIPFSYDYENDRIQYAFLFFSGEGEIVANGRAEMTPFLQQVFENFYRELVEGYRESMGSVDARVKLAHQYPLEMPESLIQKSKGSALYFRVTVDENGLVQSVSPESPLEQELLGACQRSLREWLFLPELKNGYPVASEVRVPIRLR